jgi:hypothetical protein
VFSICVLTELIGGLGYVLPHGVDSYDPANSPSLSLGRENYKCLVVFATSGSGSGTLQYRVKCICGCVVFVF